MNTSPRLWAGTRWAHAVRDSDLPSSSKLVAFVLALRMGNDNGRVGVGVDRLSKETGLSVRACRQHRQHLIDTGWLIVFREGGGRHLPMVLVAAIPEVTGTPIPGTDVPGFEDDPRKGASDDRNPATASRNPAAVAPELLSNCSEITAEQTRGDEIEIETVPRENPAAAARRLLRERAGLALVKDATA